MWLSRGRELQMPMAIWTVMCVVPSAISLLFSPYYFLPQLILPIIIAGLPWAGFGVWRIYQARRLMGAGYRLPDLQYALQVYSAQRAEELSFQFGKGPTRLGRILRVLAYAGLTICGAAAALIVSYPEVSWIQVVFEVAGWMGAGSAVLGLAIPGRDMSRDRGLERRQRFWQGRFGRLMLKVAGVFQRPAAAPERALERPTELALGQAAGALFQALPEMARADLAGLPETIAKLSAQAAGFRKKWQEMEELRVDVRTNEIEAGAALEQARVTWKQRFDETVASLELLRLGLLRLHNGAGSVSGLATDLANARTMINRLRDLGAAQAEVERLAPESRAWSRESRVASQG
jgi:hypothetical protein